MYIKLTQEQYNNVRDALRLGKYGGLETWHELLCYQQHCPNSKQVIEIAKWAARNNSGKLVHLPLKDNPTEVRKKINETPWTLTKNSEWVDDTISLFDK